MQYLCHDINEHFNSLHLAGKHLKTAISVLRNTPFPCEKSCPPIEKDKRVRGIDSRAVRASKVSF
jgi:hypothetical protein